MDVLNKSINMRKTVKCVATDCPNRTDRKYSKEISFHVFPLDPTRKAEWVAAVNRKNWKPSIQSILCSEHFQPEDLDRTSSYVRVRIDAIPSIFPRKQKTVRQNKRSSPKNSQVTRPNHQCEYESFCEESLELEVFPEELSVAQLNFRNKCEKEFEELQKKIESLRNQSNVEVIFDMEETSSGDRKRKRSVSRTSQIQDAPSGQNVVRTIAPSNSSREKKTTRRGRKPSIAKDPKPKDIVIDESRAIGGLIAVLPPITTYDNHGISTLRRIESNENRNASLIVVAKPHLRVKEFREIDRMQLDMRFKLILSYAPKRFTEWLFEQGLLKSHHNCICHLSVELKLYYDDSIKFPHSGGYIWISNCCPDKIVSVYNSSLFESSPYMPSEILKLIYHWSCQTNFKVMVQLVNVDNSYTTLVYSWLRAICTIAIQTRGVLFGGPDKKVEIGVTTLTNTDKSVKVEVMGILEVETQKIRLRALEPISEDNSHPRKQKNNILELLSDWIHPESVIACDATMNHRDFIKRGFASIQQSTSDDQNPSNNSIMIYLSEIVKPMFENSLSLLTMNVIQQYMDELVWREWYGTTPTEAFDNIMLHISQQTTIDTSITVRLAQILANPFKDWQSKV